MPRPRRKFKENRAYEDLSITQLLKEINLLRETNKRYIQYIRDKVNQLLKVMGTLPLKPEELDDETLLDFDPIGIIAEAFSQILEHMRETNRELAVARDELQAIFNATGVGISIIDTDFRILRCNEKLKALLVDKNISVPEGNYCHKIYCNKDYPGFDCPAIETMATGRTVVKEVGKKDKYFQIVTTPFKDNEGNIVGAIEVLLDITEKKKAEAAEKRQREFYLLEKSKLATIIESLSDGLLVTDQNGSIITFNNAALKITGYNASEIIGLPYHRFFQALSTNFVELETSKSTELNIRTKSGNELTISLNIAPIKNYKGEEIGKVITFRDVTEEKYRQEIYYRTEKLVALGQLSAGVAHELNTPLGNILGYARLLLKSSNLDPRQREWLMIIIDQAKKSGEIIKGLLNFARQSSPSPKNLKEANINLLLKDILGLLHQEIEKNHIRVITEFGDIPNLKIDLRLMEQALINIVINAIQAVKDQRNGQIYIKTYKEGNSVKIVIADNGPGIPEDIKPRIFDPFFTTKPVGEGTGLGLSISSGIISDHGGFIDVESTEGEGATFIITLPITN